jgi:hypothetical protein
LLNFQPDLDDRAKGPRERELRQAEGEDQRTMQREIDWDVVITLKQEKRDLYQSAMNLFQMRGPDHRFCEQVAGTRTEVELWHTDGLPFTQDHPQPVRVVRSRERVTKQHRRQDRLEPETTTHQWIWVTTLGAKAFPAPVVRSLGHDRWKQENNGWNDLTQNWALKHGFLHVDGALKQQQSRRF